MIIVVDYGMGNLRSVSKALEHLGAKVTVSDKPSDMRKSDKIVLPGVGAFGDAVQELKNRHLWDELKESIQKNKPFLGICLGLQLLFSESDESPGIDGLGIFSGKVTRFAPSGVKIPHMGWNSVRICFDHPLVKGISDQSYFYFVHSYYGLPNEAKQVIGHCEYGSNTFGAMIARDSVMATQFHPEKSQQQGLLILKNFIGL